MLEKRTDTIIKKVNNSNFRGNNNTFRIKKDKCNLSRCYGLVKVHKQGNPVRLIISALNSPTYELSKFFADFLRNNLPNSPYNVKKDRKSVV